MHFMAMKSMDRACRTGTVDTESWSLIRKPALCRNPCHDRPGCGKHKRLADKLSAKLATGCY